MHKTDIVIIGAGPVGLFAVFEAGMLKMKCHIVDALEFTGGQCNALYPEKPIYDIPAHPKINAEDLISNLEEQIKPFAPHYHLNQTVEKLEKVSDGWQVTTSTGTIIDTKAVIVAAGCGAFGPHKPPLAGLEEYEKTGAVQYMVRKIKDFTDKEIVIAGGGDSAVDWVLSLAAVAKKLSVIHRRDKFRAAPESVAQLHKLADEGKIDLIIPYQLAGLKGEQGKLQQVIVQDLEGNQKAIAADVLLPFYGLSMELGPIADWGLDLDKKHIKVEYHNMRTNIEGIYAIGDIADYQGKLKLILSGFNEAALATHDIYNIVYPDTPLHFEYSTTKGV
jgi:thioredoxin reductase (NADPH)